MNLFKRLRKSGDGKAPIAARKIATLGPKIPLVNRLTDLKEANANVFVRVRRLGSSASQKKGFIVDDHIAGIEPVDFEASLRERFGGGKYEVTFISGGRIVQMPGGDDAPDELHIAVIDAPVKTERKTPEPQSKSAGDKILEGAFAWLQKPEALAAVLGTVSQALAGRNQQVDQTQVTNGILDIIVKVKDVFSNPAPDAMGQIREVAAAARELGTLFQPPITPVGGVQQGSRGTISEIIEGVATAFRPLIEQKLFQPPPTGDGSQSPGASATPAAALPSQAGHPPGGEVMGVQAQEPKLPVIDCLGQLRRMVAAGVDPEAAGEYAARVIDAFVDLSGPQGVPPQWLDYVMNPDAAASLLPGIVPEVGARGAEYQEKFLAGAVEVLRSYAEQAEQESEGANEILQSDHIEEPAAGSQAKEPGEPSAGGGQSEGPGVNAGHDPDGPVN